MICDVLIIKDGLPLLSKSFSNSSNAKNIFSELDNLIMVSGFFSALNTFSDSFESLGTISELKLSNNNLKLSFLKETNISDLIFLATFDKDSDLTCVQSFLKTILDLFLEKYDYDQISKWNGKLDHFKAFESVIEQEINKEQILKQGPQDTNLFENKIEQELTEEEIVKQKLQDTITFENVIKQELNEKEIVKQKQHDTIAYDWLTSFETDDSTKLQEEVEHIEEMPEYFEYIPSFTASKIINPKNYLTGDTSYKVYDKIDGQKNINQISSFLKMEQIRVYNICKNLVKMGFISFN
ncbi:MAG: hypothetical protein ACXAAH_02110 [Promethearchaeota archaeon]|jgi:hypothetical protein